MVQRLLSTVLLTFLLLLLLGVIGTQREVEVHRTVYQAQSAGDPQVVTDPPPPPPPSVCDPAEYQALREGRGNALNQDWYNHLRTDGGEPDYLRYYVACQPEHELGRSWDRRWSTDEYFCIRGLLDGEHGGLAWDTDHHNGEGVNLPQAKPVSKIAGLTVRGTMEWMADYVNIEYGGPFHTPHPCHAGY